jgi:hypothetical protein
VYLRLGTAIPVLSFVVLAVLAVFAVLFGILVVLPAMLMLLLLRNKNDSLSERRSDGLGHGLGALFELFPFLVFASNGGLQRLIDSLGCSGHINSLGDIFMDLDDSVFVSKPGESLAVSNGLQVDHVLGLGLPDLKIVDKIPVKG